jgi:hypothetical protein
MQTIQLTNEDAELFLEFQKYYALFGLLKSIDAFSLQNGSVTINFNYLGQIKSVNKQQNFNQ